MSRRRQEQQRRGEGQEGMPHPAPTMALEPAGVSPEDTFDGEPDEPDELVTTASGGEVPDEEVAEAASGGVLRPEGQTEGEAIPADGASPGPEPVNEPERADHPCHAEVPAALVPAPPKPMADVSPAPVKLAEFAPAAVVLDIAPTPNRRQARQGHVFARVVGHGEFRARGYDLAGEERYRWRTGDIGEFKAVDVADSDRLEPA